MRTHSNSLTVARTSRLVATSHLVAAAALLSLAGLAQAQNAAPAPAAAPAAAPAPAAAAMEYAVLRTTKGDIVIELDRAKAPITVENFVGYIKDGFFDGTVFHRIVPGFVIQGGGFDTKGVQKKNKAPIDNEWQNGLKNKRGTLSMARTNDPKSATSQFFINVVDNGGLDMPRDGAAYAVFGRVIGGMDVVDAIRNVKTGIKGGMRDVPLEDVMITKASLLTADEAKAAAAPAAPTAPATPAAK